jgi:hypothetical protein
MDQPDHILQELRTTVAAALQRAEERLSHVQRQLAGWPELPKPVALRSGEDTEDGWRLLQQTADAIARDIDDDMAEVQQSLSRFLQEGRDLQSSLCG